MIGNAPFASIICELERRYCNCGVYDRFSNAPFVPFPFSTPSPQQHAHRQSSFQWSVVPKELPILPCLTERTKHTPQGNSEAPAPPRCLQSTPMLLMPSPMTPPSMLHKRCREAKDKAWQGTARHGTARQGKARRGIIGRPSTFSSFKHGTACTHVWSLRRTSDILISGAFVHRRCGLHIVTHQFRANTSPLSLLWFNCSPARAAKRLSVACGMWQVASGKWQGRGEMCRYTDTTRQHGA
ncbi:hypothetical protein TcWFU_002032 [Taenia crassiceps]|uniref:Uncharacterized protein n=1 Tax=Taenia crassiceps TaxID=6207 RepID=A0ABR4Q1D7_9CEST